MLVMTLIPIVGVAAYALSSMINGIAVENELKEIKIVIVQVHDLGDMVHYLEVCPSYFLKTFTKIWSNYITNIKQPTNIWNG